MYYDSEVTETEGAVNWFHIEKCLIFFQTVSNARDGDTLLNRQSISFIFAQVHQPGDILRQG